EIAPGSLDAVMVRQETAGSAYALHHSMVHAVVAEPHTVSLVIRGPAVKDRFLVMDRKTGQSWWQYGAAQEPWIAPASLEAAMSANCFLSYQIPVPYNRFPRTLSAAYRRSTS